MLHRFVQSLIPEIAIGVEGTAAIGYRAFRRHHFHLAAHQHGAQMVDAAYPGEMSVGRRAQARDLAGKWPEIAATIRAHPAYPVDRVLEQRRDRAVIFGRGDQQAVMG